MLGDARLPVATRRGATVEVPGPWPLGRDSAFDCDVFESQEGSNGKTSSQGGKLWPCCTAMWDSDREYGLPTEADFSAQATGAEVSPDWTQLEMHPFNGCDEHE